MSERNYKVVEGILFCGDVHGQFDHLIEAVELYWPRALVLLGDIEPDRPLADIVRPLEAAGTEVWFIHGNHDTDQLASWMNLGGFAARNLHGRVVEIAGVRIAGLGGIFRSEIWDPAQVPQHDSYAAYCRKQQWSRGRQGVVESILQGRALRHLSTIFPDVYERLFDQEADILVTHEAPSCHPYGFEAIDELAQALGVSRLFHGHHHDSLDYSGWEARLGFRAYGVGFCGITDAQGTRLRPGEFDSQRRFRER